MTATFRFIVPVAALLLAVLLAPGEALAQSRPVSVTDQRQTTKVIRTITKTANTADLALGRLSDNVETLLRRLKDKGVDDARIIEVAGYYQRSALAAATLAEARINRDANKQVIILRSRSNPGQLLSSLEQAQSSLIAQVRAGGAAAVQGITEALNSIVPPIVTP